jgi:hypothetical protein
MRLVACVLVLLLSRVEGEALAHPGGLDQNGGHFNRKTGEYHKHGGGSAPSSQPVPLTARIAIPAPRLSARATPPSDAAWAEGSGSRVRSRAGAHDRKTVNDKSSQPAGDVSTETSDIERNEKRAFSKLHFARVFIDEGKTDVAKQWLTDLLHEYPDSEAATEAKALLESIQGASFIKIPRMTGQN